MKKISILKLSQLSKNSMSYGQQSRLIGGNYCAWGEENQVANDTQGKCSCLCDGYDYYNTLDGISVMAKFDKYL